MELLAYGDSGWGDELFFATLMTLAVAVTAMFIGFIFSLIFTPLKIVNNKILNFIGNLNKKSLIAQASLAKMNVSNAEGEQSVSNKKGFTILCLLKVGA